jgi:hypothetical protein
MPIHSLPKQFLRTHFTKRKCQYTNFQHELSELNFTKMECQYTHCQNEISELILQNENVNTLIARMNSQNKFYKMKMPLHSFPERILRTKFYKTECQYTHWQNKFSELILQNEMPIHPLQNKLSELILPKMKMPIHLFLEQILRTKFYKTKLPIHPLPERIQIYYFLTISLTTVYIYIYIYMEERILHYRKFDL